MVCKFKFFLHPQMQFKITIRKFFLHPQMQFKITIRKFFLHPQMQFKITIRKFFLHLCTPSKQRIIGMDTYNLLY
jgi:hypothetical protein